MLGWEKTKKRDKISRNCHKKKVFFVIFDKKIKKLLKCLYDALENSENFRVLSDTFKGSTIKISWYLDKIW